MDGVEREEFLSDDLKRHGVAMCLIVIGEVAARLATSDPEFIAAHPDIPWNSIVGMRNRIAHGYHELDFGLVWDTVTAFVPDLLAKLPKPES